MSSFLSHSPPDVDPNEPGDSFESVPWESLRFDSASPDRRRWYLIAAGVGIAAIVISAITRLTPEQPIQISSSSTVASVPATVMTTTTVPEVVTEADLMAVDPIQVERLVMAFAEAAVAEFFAADAGGIWTGVEFGTLRPTYTERVSALTVTEVGGGRYRVVVAASVLDAGEDGLFERRPLRGMAVDVDAGGELLTVMGLPAPTPLPFGGSELWDDAGSVPSGPLAQAVEAWTPPFGQVEPGSATVVTDTSGSRRVRVVVVDEAGNRWPVSLPVTGDGTLENVESQP